ncbi:hypothetical protein ACOMHN_009266 [Nucella lapillus]
MSHKNLATELIVRFILIVIFIVLQPEELWLYKYPHSVDYYSGHLMWITVFSVPTVVLLGFYLVHRDREDLIQAALGVTMSIFVNGCVTNFIKMAVGRPRPDFLSRCYPDGIPDQVVYKDPTMCTGNAAIVQQGLKSFPSGHSSLSFSSLGFVSLYLAGKLHVFHRGRGAGWGFLAFLLPLVWALLIAVSRTSDYHHHWQDVTVGTILGLVTSYTCYRQVYPALSKASSHLCYSQLPSAGDFHIMRKSEFDTPSVLPVTLSDQQFRFDAKIA